MADLKPIGSEKLTGQEKINRILEIARFKEVIPKHINENSRSEYSINLADGNNYQIVKEKSGYIIKKTISESSSDYIEPMKNRKYYSSYSQALKRLNLMAKESNRLHENDEGISLFGEDKKFVLKTPKPNVPAPQASVPAEPPSVPAPELPPSPNDSPVPSDSELDSVMNPEDGMDMGGDLGGDMGGDLGGDMGGDMGSPADGGNFKLIQKLTGKLTQKMRDFDNEKGMTSEDIKYVINMVLSAVDLEKLSEEDREDILSKFESDELDDMEGMGDEENPDEFDITSDSEVEDIQSNLDTPVESAEMGYGSILDSIFSESKVDKVLSKYFDKLAEPKKSKVIKESKLDKTIKSLCETFEQESASKRFLAKNSNYKLIGKTNLNNLVFENNGSKVKITPDGIVL
jgi:hypothetical protein